MNVAIWTWSGNIAYTEGFVKDFHELKALEKYITKEFTIKGINSSYITLYLCKTVPHKWYINATHKGNYLFWDSSFKDDYLPYLERKKAQHAKN